MPELVGLLAPRFQGGAKKDVPMKITIESTSKIIHLDGLPARVWEGETESGIRIHCFVTRVAVKEGQPSETYKQFEEELKEQRKPSPEVQAIPLRFIL